MYIEIQRLNEITDGRRFQMIQIRAPPEQPEGGLRGALDAFPFAQGAGGIKCRFQAVCTSLSFQTRALLDPHDAGITGRIWTLRDLLAA
jgi:hypothetical protein